MSKVIDRRIRALEAARPQQDAGADRPQWLTEWERDHSVFKLMHTVVAHENHEATGYCFPPEGDPQAARAELRERFGDVTDAWIAEYAVLWRELQDEC